MENIADVDKLRESQHTENMLPKLAIVFIIGALAFFIFRDKLLSSTSQPGKPAEQSSAKTAKSMTFDDVLALGGTCFKNAFIDEVKDVEAAPDGESTTKGLDKDEYDINRIAVGRDGESLISIWEFVGEIGSTWSDEHNIAIRTYHDAGKSDDDRFEVVKEAKSKTWTGSLISGEDGKRTDFNPQVMLGEKNIQFSIPFNLISQNGKVDGLAFVGSFYFKPKKITYSDTLWPPQDKRVPGHYTTHYCPK